MKRSNYHDKLLFCAFLKMVKFSFLPVVLFHSLLDFDKDVRYG